LTDLPAPDISVPARLGLGARLEGDELVLELRPTAESTVHGAVRCSVISFVVDAAAGIPFDDDPDVWMLTTDMSVRMQPVAASGRLDARTTLMRRGGRSVTSIVDVTTESGSLVAMGAAGFAKVRRRPDDPVKPLVTPADAVNLFRHSPPLTRPLREEADIEVIDAAAGVVQVVVTPQLQNPAGTLQGAMVALVAEVATEELTGARSDRPMVVTDIDLRYLARVSAGPVRTRARLLGDGPDAPVEVVLFDTSDDRITTLAYTRAVAV